MDREIRVLIADDHAVLRAGIRMLVNAENDMVVVGEAADGDGTLARAMELDPDVILLDITMPNTNGLAILHTLLQKLPDCRVLIVTMHDDEGYLREALLNGASGYVLKRAADSDLLSAIRVVYQGGTYLHREHTHILLNHNGDVRLPGLPEAGDIFARLSPREHEVLRMIAMGFTNKQAAAQLFLSVKTIETYKARLMNKLGLHSRVELVRFALERGLMEEEH